ncbi:MAG TPA: cobalt ECF transporter T component CbiQ [Bacteroidetes bacterium]|nr:MAG: cobalt ECF transporter T component CbiQ [Ignavibacteria bacterium GWA2_54_16]HCA79277.1 cobalt ECF transporter T component CbiQ [Bacteroidota bacterium]
MRHDFLDRYSRLGSPIHRLPTALKLLATFSLILATVAVPFSSLWFFVVAAGLLLIVAAVSAIPWLFIFKRLLLLEPLALGIAVMALFQPNGTTIFLSIVTRSTLCLFTVILLSNTTPFENLLRALGRVGAPRILVTILALMYRYLFVLIDEGERITRARMSRTFSTNRVRRWQALASLIGQLFVRSTERAERIYAAMTARGWK